MKSLTLLVLLLTSVSAYAGGKRSTEDFRDRIPKRADAQSRERETLDGTSMRKGHVETKRDVKQNQEETDPVFYDSTTSPSEMEDDD